MKFSLVGEFFSAASWNVGVKLFVFMYVCTTPQPIIHTYSLFSPSPSFSLFLYHTRYAHVWPREYTQLTTVLKCMTNIHGDRLNRPDELLSLFVSHAKLVIQFRLIVVRGFVWFEKQKKKKNHGFIPSSAISFAIFWPKQHDTTGIFRWIITFFLFHVQKFFPLSSSVSIMLTIDFGCVTMSSFDLIVCLKNKCSSVKETFFSSTKKKKHFEYIEREPRLS